MKYCPNCNAEVDDNFEICWNCNYDFENNEIVKFEDNTVAKKDIRCLRCDVQMSYSGNYDFHEGTDFGFFGNFFELFTNRESFDIYVCNKCGKVEFFIPESKIN
ncbi:MAG: hypothetical protein LBV75_06235 [Paludibacter sp.]|jgi:DNA-directed RNA polymerase subunit RPC12/RpoP|nr:hypothetical protein [Paludibacter sp.]